MGRAPCCDTKDGLKKGAWTAEEDEKLVSFIRNNNGSHGSWRSLPQLAGLQRCGKSCRLRWINYLRPNIKRGNFSPEEEEAIAQLHALWGNKWSNIASHLPGRTDNEVKNHWNTHLKKRLISKSNINITNNPSCIISLLNTNYKITTTTTNNNNNNNNIFNRLHNNCSHISSSPVTRRIDESFVSHMAQWELARLEAEARLAPATSASAPLRENAKLSTSSNITASGAAPSYTSPLISSPSTYSSCSLRQSDHDQLFQDFPELLDMGAASAADNSGAALLASFESSSMSSACGVTDERYGNYNSQDRQYDELMRRGPAISAAAAMPGSPPEAEITSNYAVSLLPAESLLMSMMSPGPIPAFAHQQLPDTSDQPCEAITPHAYWANVLNSLVGPVMSCPS